MTVTAATTQATPRPSASPAPAEGAARPAPRPGRPLPKDAVPAQPLPADLVPPAPGDWDNSPIAGFYYYSDPGGKEVHAARPSPARGNATPAFVFAGRNFDDALVQAGDRARRFQGYAQGLMQSRDGSYYLTHLAHDFNRNTRQVARSYEVIDGADGARYSEIVATPEHPDLKAVVGTERYFDYRNGEGRKAAPTAGPFPLPAAQPSDPAGLPRSAARMHYRIWGLNRVPESQPATVTPGPAPGETYAWAGKDFRDAVAEASGRARAHDGAAQAVLQGSDGAYWISNLGYSTNLGRAEMQGSTFIDSDWVAENRYIEAGAVRKHDALKAIVGSDAIIDFTAPRTRPAP